MKKLSGSWSTAGCTIPFGASVWQQLSRQSDVTVGTKLVSQTERTAVPPLGGEREILEGYLDRHRDTLEWKCAGLTEQQLKSRAYEPSAITLLGLLRHMAEVEYYWFESVLLGRDENLGVFGSEDDPEGDFTDLDSHSVEFVLDHWKRACQASREHAAAIEDLSHVASRPRSWDGRQVSLRYILAHMVEEYVRHNGHADFLRERIDGGTGV